MIVVIGGVTFVLRGLPQDLKTEEGHVYIYQCVDRSAFLWSRDPPQDSPFGPSAYHLVSMLDQSVLERRDFCFFYGTNFLTGPVNFADWALFIGFYSQEGGKNIVVVLKFNAEKKNFSLVNSQTNEVITSDFPASKIHLVEHKTQKLYDVSV